METALQIGSASGSARISSATNEFGFPKSQLGFLEIRIGKKFVFWHIEKHESTKDPKEDIRTYGVLGPSEENVLHTNNADPRVQDNPSFSTQMAPISNLIFHILSRSKWKMNSFTCDKCMSSTQR